MSRSVFFSVGEPSGDLHAARLIDEMRRRAPGLRFTGFGGPRMQAAGCEIHYRLVDLAVMGILAVIPLLGRFLSLILLAGRTFDRQRPAAVVLVDFPGFNWWIARQARRRGIPVFYYLPPQLWAWAPWRIRKLRRLVDEVLCCLPFEYDWYRRRNVAAHYVGHPFFDEVADRPLDHGFIAQQREKRGTDGLVVGVLPGSRNAEIEHNFDVQLQVVSRLSRQFPAARFLVAAYRDSQREACEKKLRRSRLELPIEFHVGRTSEIIEAADACLMVSGSVSLEMVARTTPAVVIYRSGRIRCWLARRLLLCPYISLPNLIAGREVLPEFLMGGNDPRAIGRIVEIVSDWLGSSTSRGLAAGELARLTADVGRPGATSRAATAIFGRIGALTVRARARAA